MGLSFNLNFQPGLKFHSEVVISDDDALKPALYQGLVEGLQVCGLLLAVFHCVRNNSMMSYAEAHAYDGRGSENSE